MKVVTFFMVRTDSKKERERVRVFLFFSKLLHEVFFEKIRQIYFLFYKKIVAGLGLQ